MADSDRTARVLMDRVEALATALRAAGVDPAVSERLLGSAAAAAMDALALDLLVADAPAPAAVTETRRDEQPVPLAA
jgi:hypothetical protein